MILFDNIIFAMQRKGGVSRFWANLIKGVTLHENACFIEHPSSKSNIYRSSLELQSVYKDMSLPVSILRYMNVGTGYSVIKRPNYNVFHSSYYRICNQPGVTNITTVHDLMYEKFASGPALWLHKAQKLKALRKSDCLVCISENTKIDLLEFYPECERKDIRVIPNGVSGYADLAVFNDFHVNRISISPRSYFLYVGHRGECKGFDRVFTVLKLMQDINLIVVGASFTGDENDVIRSYGLIDRIINLEMVGDADLNTLYSNAEFFFFPSLYEGFGIPPIEAMMSKCPVVASNRSSIPEVVGDAAILFDPDSDVDIEAAVKRVRDDSIRNYLINKGEQRVLNFSWDSVVDQYLSVYNDYSK